MKLSRKQKEMNALREQIRKSSGDFGFLHEEMFQKFSEWKDDLYLKFFGFRISELKELESIIVRWSSMNRKDPSNKEVAEELDKLNKKYDEIWLPRIHMMEDLRNGL